MRKTKLIAAAAALTMICSAVPSFAADSHPSNVLMVCDFEGASNLASTSTGTGEVTKAASPSASSYHKIATSAKTDADSVAANVAALDALRAAGSSNTVLKTSQQVASDTNTVTLYEGKIPKDFALDFSMFSIDSFANTRITISQNGATYNLIRVDSWASTYLTDSRTRFAMESPDVWTPYTLIFKDFASADTILDVYHLGRYNYTATATNPQGYTSATVSLGDFYNAIDLSQDVKIDIITTGLSSGGQPVSMYFDNIRIYTLNQTIGDTASKDFESDTISMLPMQNGIRTGGFGSRQWAYITDTVKKNFKLEAYTMNVEADPLDPSNKVLKCLRGEAANEYTYDSAARFTVKKPDKSLTIKFKALTSDGLFNIAADVADGTFKDVFYAYTASTPADRIFTLSQTATGQFSSSGRYNGKFASSFNWTANTWNDVTMVYDVETNKTSFDINGVTFDVTPNNTILADMMASTTEDTITVAIFQPYPNVDSYIMLDDISIISESNEVPEPSDEITATDAQPLLYSADDSDAGLFWNVTVPVLDDTDTVNAVFTDSESEKTLTKTIDLSNFDGPGSGVFSVLLVGAPNTVTAAFTAAE